MNYLEDFGIDLTVKNDLILVQCCKCNKVLLKDQWVLKSTMISSFFNMFGYKLHWSHGYCPTCAEIELKKIDNMPPVCHISKSFKENRTNVGFRVFQTKEARSSS